jgi:hypothetical protein
MAALESLPGSKTLAVIPPLLPIIHCMTRLTYWSRQNQRCQQLLSKVACLYWPNTPNQSLKQKQPEAREYLSSPPTGGDKSPLVSRCTQSLLAI